ncbi:hypothetical protein CAOG_04016 [Capsaspora owczarzaki ATCC 30864]|uniref:Uncharacterized protein n=1 Tax=Capsaspora owczarzaki (strain ATCC 30864) TaxID=595528 RepID=A0A0D2UDQ6_CAPO3|nr:hypothetical protein CAOG_04016 [Capsaspora owczarzaki ATCC 30864]KJE93191.1 hypothetical protein CAOG_004016 [Capsaspora owczarzaki ATCC 30864]|eukprot:XP_004347841.1 hypothetical protein CAOG_04016 [Capsaspora owczarzaki ATCC 30864]
MQAAPSDPSRSPSPSPSPSLATQTTTTTPAASSSRKWVFLAVGGASLVGFYAVIVPFLAPAFRKHCLPFVPASPRQIQLVLNQCKPTGTLVDLGSGDGRVVIAAAKQLRIPCTGYELNRWLVYYSRYSAWRNGVGHLCKFETRNLWHVNLTPFSQVVIFGVKEMFADLERKFAQELQPSATVIAGRFALPTWQSDPTRDVVDPKGEMGIHSVWTYSVGANQQQTSAVSASAAPETDASSPATTTQ